MKSISKMHQVTKDQLIHQRQENFSWCREKFQRTYCWNFSMHPFSLIFKAWTLSISTTVCHWKYSKCPSLVNISSSKFKKFHPILTLHFPSCHDHSFKCPYCESHQLKLDPIMHNFFVRHCVPMSCEKSFSSPTIFYKSSIYIKMFS